MARKKVTPEEEIVNTAVEGTALGSVPAGSVLHDEAGADTGDVPAELPEGDLSAEETAEQSETLPAMEAAEAKPFGLSAAEKTASQEENDTVEKRAEEAELHEETSEFLEAAEDLHSNRRMNTWQQITPKRLMRRMKRASARSSTSWTSMNWIGG